MIGLLEKQTTEPTSNSLAHTGYLKTDKITQLKLKYGQIFSLQIKKLLEHFICSGEDNIRFKNDMYKQLGIPKTTLYDYLNGKLPKNTDTLLLIKDYFQTSFAYLFGETNSMISSVSKNKLKYKLSDKSLDILENLTKKSKDNDIDATNTLHTIDFFIENKEIRVILTKLYNSYKIKSDIKDLKRIKIELFLELDEYFDKTIKLKVKPKNKNE